MKKIKKVVLLSLIFVFILNIPRKIYQETYEQKEKFSGEKKMDEKESKKGWMIKVNDKIYHLVGESRIKPTCGTGWLSIENVVSESEVPTENNTANFSGSIKYLYSNQNQIEVLVNDTWYEFISEE